MRELSNLNTTKCHLMQYQRAKKKRKKKRKEHEQNANKHTIY